MDANLLLFKTVIAGASWGLIAVPAGPSRCISLVSAGDPRECMDCGDLHGFLADLGLRGA